MAYPTDLSDEQWCLVRHLFDPPRCAGRPHRWSRRRMVNAMLWQAKTGGQWRMLPSSFPPWGSVWQQFRRWRDGGVWADAMTVLRREVRVRSGRDPELSLVILDAQQARTGRQGPSFHPRRGLGQLIAFTTYGAASAGRTVNKVKAPYTSQTCANPGCGHMDAASRVTRDHFCCTSCGHVDHADANAVRVVLAVGEGRLKIKRPSRTKKKSRPGSGHPPVPAGRDAA